MPLPQKISRQSQRFRDGLQALPSCHDILSTMLLELFSNEGEHPRCAKAIVRRFILWSLVCWVSAAPSFGLVTLGRTGGRNSEAGGFDPWAMACAITLFSILYTTLTTSAAFDRFHRIRGVRRTLYIATGRASGSQSYSRSASSLT